MALAAPGDKQAASRLLHDLDSAAINAASFDQGRAADRQSKPRVLHLLHTSLPTICGYSIRSDYILRNQLLAGLQVAAVTSASHPAGMSGPDAAGGIRYWRTPPYRGTRIPILKEFAMMRAMQARIESAIREWRPHLLHAHSPVLVGLPALRAARKFDLPLVYEIRDLWENASVDRGKFTETSPLYRLARKLDTYVLRRADAVTCICENLRIELSTRVDSSDRLFVVDNGVDASAFTQQYDYDSLRRQWNLVSKKVLAYVGTFQPYEGLSVLIRALPILLLAEPDTHLVITGAGGVENDLKAEAEAMGLQSNVTFTGRLTHDRVGEIYGLADVLVYPRVLTRTTALTTPLKPLEAMASAKAVVVSNVPGLQELVKDGKTGVVFKAGDPEDLAAKVFPILRSPEYRNRLGNSAREWVLRERQWSDLVPRYEEIYRLALERRTA